MTNTPALRTRSSPQGMPVFGHQVCDGETEGLPFRSTSHAQSGSAHSRTPFSGHPCPGRCRSLQDEHCHFSSDFVLIVKPAF